ncbi:MAG TPA: PD-(D/E)XK nuclease-like domain-containing protein [Pseudonocardiaceae bacterium]
MTATVTRPVITEPGIYDMTDEQYHADPVPGGSLSSTGARMLLPPKGCPALFRHAQLTPAEPTDDFDFGHAAHKLVLGAGQDIVVVDADSWRTNDAKNQAAKARDAGAVPLLAHEYDVVEEMATVLRDDPAAAALFAPGSGRPEQSLFWQDDEFGVWRRARLDWLPNPTGSRMIIADYKTARSVEPTALSKAMADHGYYQQACWYMDAVQALGLAPHGVTFVFVFQMKKPPYLVTVAQPDPYAMHFGGLRNAKALDIYAECRRTNVWPGFADKPITLPLPRWSERANEDAWERGDYTTSKEKTA